MSWGGRYGRGKNRKVPGKMSTLEVAYEKNLVTRKYMGEILWYNYEGCRLKLADLTTYTPDFVVLTKDLILEMHEVKGMWEQAARVKIKVAADLYPFKFIAITKEAGQWAYEEIG